MGALSLLLEWETHRRAVGNGPVWHALYRCGVLQADAGGAAREAAAIRFLGFVPISPDGSPYRYDKAADEVVSARHGSLRRPEVHAAPDEKSPVLVGLNRLRTLRADLTFREDGVQTLVTIDRATPAEAKAETTAPGAAIRRLGGRVVIDERDPARPVVKAELRGSGAGDGDLAALRGLDAVREIDLGSTRVTDQGLAALHGLAGLRRVYLDGTAVTDAGAAALRKAVPGVEVMRWTDAEQRLLAALERLGGRYDRDPIAMPGQVFSIDLAGTRADDEALALLRVAERLESLRLTRTAVTDKGLAHLHGLTKLRRVYLGKGVTDAGADALRKAVPGVEVIRWSDAERRAVEAVVALRGTYRLDGAEESGPVVRIDLGSTATGDATLELLKGATNLQTLRLSNTPATDKGLAHLHGLAKLKAVYLSSSGVTDAGADALRKAVPGVQVIRWTDAEQRLVDAVVRLGGKFEADGSEYGPILRVNLAGTHADDKAVALLAGMKELRELDLTGTSVTDKGLAPLRDLGRLGWVSLDDTPATDDGEKALRAALPEARVMRRNDRERVISKEVNNLAGTVTVDTHTAGGLQIDVNLAQTRADDATLKLLKDMEHLTSLNIDNTVVTDAGLKHLHGLKSLKSLGADAPGIMDAGAGALAKARPALTIRRRTDHERARALVSGLGGRVTSQRNDAGETELSINLRDTGVTATDLATLPRLGNIRSLNLAHTRVRAADLDALKKMTGLRSLDLTGTKVGDAGLKAVEGLTELESLDLTWTSVTDDGLAHLKPLTKLRTLTLCGTEVGDRGMAHLAHLKKLTELNVVNTNVTAAGEREVRAALPKVAVDR
jgi:hypothetical protein